MKRFISLVLALIMTAALCACGGEAQQTQTQTGETSSAESSAESVKETSAEDGRKVLRIGTTIAAQSFSPTSEGSLPLYLAYEYLCRADAEGNITNWLAEDIEWLDEQTLRIKLRDGIYFANGEQMTGEDVLYSLQYAATATGSMLRDKYAHADFDASYVEDDGMTVIVKTKDVYSELSVWLVKLALTDKSQAESRASNDPDWWDKPITSSAYEIVENVDGSHITFRLRDDYWDKENMPQWDEITFNYFSNATAMFIAYENGELDLVLQADYKDYDRTMAGDIANADKTSAYTVTVNGVMNLILNPYCEYFDDPKVREAFSHAIDTDAVGLVAYGSLYKANLESYLSACFPNAYEAQGVNTYDPELAQQLMAESGYPNGFELTCIAQEADKTALEIIKENLAALGVTLNVETYDFATMLATVLTPGATDIGFFGGTLSSVDAYESISAYYDGNAITTSRVLDPEFNELYYSVPQIFDEGEKNETLKQMQRWIYNSHWVLPVCEVSCAVVYNNAVLDCRLENLTVGFVQYECVPVG